MSGSRASRVFVSYYVAFYDMPRHDVLSMHPQRTAQQESRPGFPAILDADRDTLRRLLTGVGSRAPVESLVLSDARAKDRGPARLKSVSTAGGRKRMVVMFVTMSASLKPGVEDTFFHSG